jgi:hypothetical protein
VLDHLIATTQLEASVGKREGKGVGLEEMQPHAVLSRPQAGQVQHLPSAVDPDGDHSP